MNSIPPLLFLLIILFLTTVSTQAVNANTWCGKRYEHGEPIVPPAGQFGLLGDLIGSQPPFRCVARFQPYLEADDCDSSVSVLVDFPVAHSSTSNHALTITIEDHIVARRNLETNVTSLELQISVCGVITPRRKPYTMTCLAEIEHPETRLNNTSVYVSTLSYLPNPRSSSVTKLDRKTGALLTKSTNGIFEPIFPIGFYTNFGGYLAANLSLLDELKDQGFNTIHPVPPFDDMVAFQRILDHIDKLGLYLMYDMRHSYQDLQSMAREVEELRHRKSLLLWYTADEPDGPGDPLDAPRAAYDVIYELDGYHPVAISLNCADHFFKEYVAGADIILPDVYMIGINVTFSSKYGTPCTKDFGCCGCDNCQGRFEDISERLDDTNTRLRALAWDRTKFIWSVTQAFGGEEFWTRPPSEREWLVQAILSINHGARGIIPWIDPTPIDIKQAASRLAKVLPQIIAFLFDPDVSFSHLLHNHVDVGSWTRGSDILILATNMDSKTSSAPLPSFNGRHIIRLLEEGISLDTAGGLMFLESLGSAVIVIYDTDTKAPGQKHDEL